MTEIVYRSDMKVELVESWGSDESVARAARVSTNSDLLDHVDNLEEGLRNMEAVRALHRQDT